LSLEREVYYSRHCSGKWMDKPEVFIEHGVNKKFHYWKDVVEHLSTAEWKSRSNKSGGKTMLYLEAPWIIDSGWVTPVDKMNKEYFDYIIAEKKYGVDKAKWALEKIESAKDHIVSAEAYDQLHLLYEKTHLTAQLYLYANKVWFGFRVYQNDPSEEMLTTIKTAFIDLQNVADEMKAYPKEKLPGQYVWQNDIYTAEKLIMEIKEKLKENKSTPD